MGPRTVLFLAKSLDARGMGGWSGLRLYQPITVAGPRPIRTAFSASRACKLREQCNAAAQ